MTNRSAPSNHPPATDAALPRTPTDPHSARPEAKPDGSENIVWLWTLRLMTHYLCSRRLFGRGIARQSMSRWARGDTGNALDNVLDEVAATTGIKFKKISEGAQSLPRVVRQLQRRIRLQESKVNQLDWINNMNPNARESLLAIRSALGLNDVELQCLAFLLMLKGHELLSTIPQVMDCALDDAQATEVIAATIGQPLRSVQDALSRTSKLMASLLVRRDHEKTTLDSKFDWVTDGFPEEMMLPGFDPIRALRNRVVHSRAPTLAWSQFAHLGPLRDVALSYLRLALASQKCGVNVLLHGKPGVGKTEFTRALAKELDCPLFEVSTEDGDGDPIEGYHRLQALRVLHGFCSGHRQLIIFDEIEDVFPRPDTVFSNGRRTLLNKGFVNRVAETNANPTFWVTNSVETLDPAFVRRFDLVLEIKNPPAALREAQLRNLAVVLPDAAIHQMSACLHLTPAVVSRADAVVSSIKGDLPEGQASQILLMVVDQTLQAQGLEPLRKTPSADCVYNPAYINSDFDPIALVEGIRAANSARLCLYGPPGTGKTAYGHWLAHRLGRQLHLKRASDLLSPYVGVAEKNMARAFRDAENAGAVLLVDEVDSFLQDRSKAQRSWELTQVNEFLTQLEQFEGVFIASTNLMDGLDPAALRRFDLKAKFGFLRADQTRALLAAHLTTHSIPAADSAQNRRLDYLENLTPGDFATISRQHQFRACPSAETWVTALELEAIGKTNRPGAIFGFARPPH